MRMVDGYWPWLLSLLGLTVHCSLCSCRTLEPMDYMGEEYFKLKASIIKYERFLLRVRALAASFLIEFLRNAFFSSGVGVLCSHQASTQGNGCCFVNSCTFR